MGSRRLGSALLGALALCCSSPAPAPLRTASVAPLEVQAAEPASSASRIRVLPAGIFFRAHTYRPCDHVDESEQPTSGLCTEPRAAVVAGVFARQADAQRALDRAQTLKLAPGYPFAAHSDELGLAAARREGLVVILGLFEKEREASAWLAERALANAEIVRLLDPEAAFEQHEQSRKRFAVQIDSEKPVPAYAAKHSEGTARQLCEIKPGSLFVADEEALQSHWYEWAPVRCGRELAYVKWTSTRLTASVWQRSDGSSELLQIVEVSCDRATFGSWRFERNRRLLPSEDDATASAPCGG